MSKRVVISLISKQRGGLEESFVYFANLAQRLGYEVIAVTPRKAPYLKNLSPSIKRRPFHPHGYFDVLSFIKLFIELRLTPPSLLIGFNSRAVHYLTFAAQLLNIRVIAFSGSDKLSRLKRADAIVCNSLKMIDNFASRGFLREKLYFLPAIGIEIDTLSSIQTMSDSADSNSKIRVGFLGRMTSEKGVLTLIEACQNPILRQRIQLIIAGEGPERRLAEELTGSLGISAEFRGWVDNKTSFYEGIDLLVVPSLSETFGIVILEAMAAGVPVISTPTQGPSMLITEGVSGWITRDFTSTSITEKLICVIDNKKYWQTIRNGALKSLQRYSNDTISAEFKRLLESHS